ncbi:MAG: hypothetical protein AB7O73_07875 [Bacteroidia bacterium]
MYKSLKKTVIGIFILITGTVYSQTDSADSKFWLTFKGGWNNRFLIYGLDAEYTYRDVRGYQTETFSFEESYLSKKGPMIGIGVNFGATTQFEFSANYMYNKVPFSYNSHAFPWRSLHASTNLPLPFIREITLVNGYFEESTFSGEFNIKFKSFTNFYILTGASFVASMPKVIAKEHKIEYYEIIPAKITDTYNYHGYSVPYYPDSITTYLYSEEKQSYWKEPNIGEQYARIIFQFGGEFFIPLETKSKLSISLKTGLFRDISTNNSYSEKKYQLRSMFQAFLSYYL